MVHKFHHLIFHILSKTQAYVIISAKVNIVNTGGD